MEDLFFAFEVEIDGAISNSRFARNVGNFGIEIAVVGKDADRRTQDSFALVDDYGPE
jgi:hypothetical protein